MVRISYILGSMLAICKVLEARDANNINLR